MPFFVIIIRRLSRTVNKRGFTKCSLALISYSSKFYNMNPLLICECKLLHWLGKILYYDNWKRSARYLFTDI